MLWLAICRFIGASVGSGKSPTWGKVSAGYKFVQIINNRRNNLKPIRGTIQNLERWLVEYDSDLMLYTVESQLEDEMSSNSSTNKRDQSHTPVLTNGTSNYVHGV
jgi:hypothetical protein